MTDETGSQPSSEWQAPGAERAAERVQRQVERAGATGTGAGSGDLFSEPVLVVNQKVKLIELTNEYRVFDQHGTEIGSVAQVNQTTLKKVARFVSSLDQFMTHTYEIRDAQHEPRLVLTRPRKIVKSRFEISRPDGSVVGEIAQKNVFGKIRFSLLANGTEVGSLNAENWRAWNFSIQDPGGTEVARITKTWEGLVKTAFTTADNYVVQIHRPLDEPLRSLAIAAALCVDTALKQDSRGLG
jgi:uncharacterized protein YxjI